MSASFITAPSLTLPGMRHAFFTRQGGVSEGIYASLNGGRGSNDDPKAVIENRRRMTDALGVEENMLATPYQVHSATAVTAVVPWLPGDAPQADAVVTSTPDLAVGIATADCGPILFADAEARVIGAAHAGWKGALTGVLDATVDAMEKLGARRGSIAAVLGPCIRQTSYEVGPEFVERFCDADGENRAFFALSAKDGYSMFDLGGYIVQRLKRTEIASVTDLDLDTYPDEERFFSYRRTTHRGEPDYGRLVAAIALSS